VAFYMCPAHSPAKSANQTFPPRRRRAL
jgi:hypothetical protein